MPVPIGLSLNFSLILTLISALLIDEKDYTPWVDFFLKGVIRQCEHNIELIQKLRKLKEENSQMIRASIKGSQVAQHILELVLNTMFITAPQARSYLDKIKLPLKDSYQAALNNLRRLEKLGILEKIEGNEREIKFVHAELKKLIMGG
jgi:Fic family protein